MENAERRRAGQADRAGRMLRVSRTCRPPRRGEESGDSSHSSGCLVGQGDAPRRSLRAAMCPRPLPSSRTWRSRSIGQPLRVPGRRRIPRAQPRERRCVILRSSVTSDSSIIRQFPYPLSIYNGVIAFHLPWNRFHSNQIGASAKVLLVFASRATPLGGAPATSPHQGPHGVSAMSVQGFETSMPCAGNRRVDADFPP